MPFALATLLLFALLIAVAWIDIKTHRIPDPLNLAIGVAGLAIAALNGAPLLDQLLGAVAGFGLIWAANAYYRARRGRDGIGMGDAKLLAAGGAWLGWAALPFVALIGASLGLAAVAALRLAGRPITADSRIAFGPFLAIGIAGAWLMTRL
jgi:leader peptidase (prepilin peptidase)/N-methyltransferase